MFCLVVLPAIIRIIKAVQQTFQIYSLNFVALLAGFANALFEVMYQLVGVSTYFLLYLLV